jgi:hypothetical protein
MALVIAVCLNECVVLLPSMTPACLNMPFTMVRIALRLSQPASLVSVAYASEERPRHIPALGKPGIQRLDRLRDDRQRRERGQRDGLPVARPDVFNIHPSLTLAEHVPCQKLATGRWMRRTCTSPLPFQN